MKKIFGILLLTLMVAGCGTLTDEEAKTAALDTLENIYFTVYLTDGVGLPVYAETTKESEGTWYLVAGEYTKYSEIESIIDASLDGDVKKNTKETISQKYKDIDGALYSKGESGCALPYTLDNAREEIEKVTTVEKIKSNEITIKVNDKEYTLKKSGDNWVSENKIFGCAE